MLPKFLEKNNWQNPTSQSDTPLLIGHNATGKSLWDLVATTPIHDQLMEHMKYFSEGHKEWTDVYPIVERLGTGTGTSAGL